MDPRWKRFEALVTDSRSNVFFKARLKLTALYVLVVALIIFGFSIFLYQSIGHNLKDASEDDFAGAGPHQHFVENTLSTVEEEILLADLFILLVSAGVSYMLAGYTLRPIQRSVEAQKIFSENASHELRTPLAVMKNDAEVLLRHPNPPQELVRSTLRSNIEEIDRLSKMSEELLMLARSENHVGASVDKIDITALGKNLATKMGSIATERGASLHMVFDTPVFIQGNVSALERVFMNILQNAIDHTPKGGSVSIEAAQEGAEALITITDTGGGIKAKDLPHIFERFYKGEGAAGTGLGLSIVKQLVEKHGGNIFIQSTEGKGTIVAIRLPLSP